MKNMNKKYFHFYLKQKIQELKIIGKIQKSNGLK